MANQLPTISLPGKVTRTALELPERLTVDDWLSVGEQLKACEGSVMWWIGDWWAFGEHKYGERAAQAFDPETEKTRFQTYMDAGWVARKFETSRRREVLSWSFHREVAACEEADQEWLLDQAEENGWTIAQLRKAVRARRKERHKRLGSSAPVTGLYETLVIDPPWPMEKIARRVAPNQVGFDYPTMEEDELAALDIPVAENGHVFVWTTHKFLPMSLKLLEAWNLTYICTFVWHKNGGFQPFGLPQYNCEFALYARRGTPEFLSTKNFFVCFDGDRREHSRKPDSFYDMVRRTTKGPRLDMFSREPREGFDQWGNEPEKFKETP